MVTTNQRCERCAQIDFDECFFSRMTRGILGKWKVILIQAIYCPFCRLVVDCLAGHPDRPEPEPDDEIALHNHLSWELGIEQSPYDRLKSEAYSNKCDLRSMAKACKQKAYRLVVSVEGQPEIRGFIQYIPSEEDDKKNRYFFGRVVKSAEVSVKLLKSWLYRCEDWHGEACEEDGIAGRRLPDNLRLIDVEKRQITKPSKSVSVEYVTLSYVWGVDEMKDAGIEPAELHRADIQRDENGDEITPLPEKLPQTIEDTITLTSDLGFQYLWVDALCIVQDDPDWKKEATLERMDAIYNCSSLTIAAASGRHGHVGLPGISTPRKMSQYSERIEGKRMASMSPSFTALENSKLLVWNSRGWTFQEKILAKRLLLFTDYQVYFKCSESIWTEEIMMETQALSDSMEARSQKYRWGPDRPLHTHHTRHELIRIVFPYLEVDDPWSYLGQFPDYVAAVREYSQRSLTKPEDALRAVGGVFRTMESSMGEFHYGLPEVHFLQSLLWYPEPGSIHQRANPNFPTWSWAGWTTTKGVGYDVLDVRVLRTIMIALRKLGVKLGKAAAKLMDSMSSGKPSSPTSSASSPSSTTTTSSSSYQEPMYSSPSSYASGPSPSTSSPFDWSQLNPFPNRDWSTRKIVKRATGNLVCCFGLPIVIRTHTAKDLLLYDGKDTIEIESDQTLKFSTFLEEEISTKDSLYSRSFRTKRSYKSRTEPSRMSRKLGVPLLTLSTVVVKFFIGECLHKVPPTVEDEAGIFELLDPKGDCIGEVWTTLRNAKRGRKRPLHFLTISWGLSLSVAKVAPNHVPKWLFDAAKLPESETFNKWRPTLEKLFESPPHKGLAGTYGQTGGPQPEQPSVVSFFNAVLNAEKGKPQPRWLWSTVNLLLVDFEDDIAYREGVGRVMFSPWFAAAMEDLRPEEVMLA